jgi:hypothetical protein
MKIELFKFDAYFLTLPSCTIIAAAPQTVAPAADQEQTIPLPAVPQRGPEAGFHLIHYDFMVRE